MTRIWPVLLITLPFLRADTSKDDCQRPAYLPRLPQRLQGEVVEIWTDPEPETTLTYADEPVIFKPSCDWRMSRTRMLLSKLTRSEYYRIFARRGSSPPRTTARVSTLRQPASREQGNTSATHPSPTPTRPATPPPTQRYSTLSRPQSQPRRGNARTRPVCRPPASVSRLPPANIWRRQQPRMTCAEMHRKTKQIMINLPLRLRSALGRSKPKKAVKTEKQAVPPPQLDCKLPHFLNRLEPALQEKLQRVWAGFREGEDCRERVQQQLSILKANDISVESFRMPFPSLYEDDLTTAPRKRASRRA